MGLTQTNPTDVSPFYAIRNNQAQKKPVFYVTFGLVTGPLGTNSQVVPYQFCTGPIQNATASRLRYMSAPTSAPNTVSLISYQASLSAITFALQDIGGLVTLMCSSFTMKNRLVTIYKGYEDIDEQYYSSVYVGQINNIQMSPDGTQYIFTVTDPQKQLTTEILKGHSQLITDFNPGQTTMYLTTSFYFANATDLQDGNGLRNYIKVNDSLFSYVGNASGIIIDNFVTWTYIGHGTITASTPQWIAGKGYTTDNTATWAFIGPQTSTVTATPWVINTSYNVGNTVLANGNVYTCAISGTSAGAGTGPSSVGYNITNKVFNLGNVYQCVVAGSSSPTSITILDGTCRWKWVALGNPTTAIAQWLPITAYVVGNNVFNSGSIYTCTQSGTSGLVGSLGPTGVAIGPNGLGSVASALFGVQQVVLSGNGATPSQTHQAGSTVDNYILFQGNPITIMLQIIMSTGTGANWSGTGTNYDVLPASQGIGVPYSLVNITNFLNQSTRFISWMYFSNYFTDQVSAIKFFQDHIFKQCQLFTYTNKSGQLDLQMVYYPLPTNNYTQIDDTNIIGIPTFDFSLQTGNNFINEVDVLWDYQPIADFFVNEAITINNSSQEQYEESAIDEIDCKFVSSYYSGAKIANRISNVSLKLYGNPLPVIKVKCFSQLQTVNPGDTILLASSQTPNLKTGLKGGSVFCMCIASAPNFQDDTCTLTLYATGYASNKRYAVIGPAGMPNYTASTTLQKNYVFISTLVPGNFAQGAMSNGDDGYYITG